MKETLQFLRDLSKNNNKNWFDANKDRYLAARSSVETLAGELLSGIRSFDDTVGPLSPKDCTYRIYRDLRFSKAKTHMGLYINQGGKKSGYSGYYFHVGAKSYGNMVAIGDIWCPPEVLKVIREVYKLKAFCLYYAPDDRFVTSRDRAVRLVDIFRTTKPFLDYINRAIDFVREEKKEYFSSLDF